VPEGNDVRGANDQVMDGCSMTGDTPQPAGGLEATHGSWLPMRPSWLPKTPSCPPVNMAFGSQASHVKHERSGREPIIGQCDSSCLSSIPAGANGSRFRCAKLCAGRWQVEGNDFGRSRACVH
jgi:hypothetical protein